MNYPTEVPLTHRDMGWERMTETVTRMDAGAEPPIFDGLHSSYKV